MFAVFVVLRWLMAATLVAEFGELIHQSLTRRFLEHFVVELLDVGFDG